ncbi:thioesterase family protein [Sphingobium sp. EM0848]|uniref:acyl-CoA thioesterase n=1 Tax=Sphingobium sp. EM0848 TaxID=2743473 RepID=UPI00159CA431|nr:hypothetical protein [Sphingobium sp. EM0848]
MSAFLVEGAVRWSEADASGRFHYANALLWAVSAEYLQPFLAGDAYMVRLWVERLGNSSVTYGWQILSGEVPAVEGRHSVVHVDATGRAAPISATLRAGLSGYLMGAG